MLEILLADRNPESVNPRLEFLVSISCLRFFSLIVVSSCAKPFFAVRFNLMLEILLADRFRDSRGLVQTLYVSISCLRFFSLIGGLCEPVDPALLEFQSHA